VIVTATIVGQEAVKAPCPSCKAVIGDYCHFQVTPKERVPSICAARLELAARLKAEIAELRDRRPRIVPDEPRWSPYP
jgi:hypothetical protein